MQAFELHHPKSDLCVQGTQVCAVFNWHLKTGMKRYASWGKVQEVEDDMVTVRWDGERDPTVLHVDDVHRTEEAAFAAAVVKDIESQNGAPQRRATRATKGQSQPAASATHCDVPDVSDEEQPLKPEPGKDKGQPDFLSIGDKRYDVPAGYRGSFKADQEKCDMLWKLSKDQIYGSLSKAARKKVKKTDCKRSLIFHRVCAPWL